jgi:hypothetical protein
VPADMRELLAVLAADNEELLGEGLPD